ncbi:substrate-binding domain-containing protein, partial [Burkholderia sola]
HVPRDIAITGIDNAPYGQYSEPALTTVDTQSEKMGELATLKVFEALAGRHDGERVLLEPRLVVRESAANRTGPGPR